MFMDYYQTGILLEETVQVIDISALDDVAIALPTPTCWFLKGKIPLPPRGSADVEAGGDVDTDDRDDDDDDDDDDEEDKDDSTPL